jgi:Rod binding domain-containing protein
MSGIASVTHPLLVEGPGAETRGLQRPRQKGESASREAFQAFVAGTFYKQMLKSLRSTVDKAEYFHGGRAEEVFEAQLDQQVAEDLAARQGGVFADKLYDAFIHRR